MNYIIGCGGVGSWLTPSLCLLEGAEAVCVWDGDTLEEGNLNRQLFTPGDIGINKAQAVAALYGCVYLPQFFSYGVRRMQPHDCLIGCVDNNAARLAILESADDYQCAALFAANETTSAEAYIYFPAWRGTALDPRKYYPEITTDKANDPRNVAIGCTGKAQEQRPQLVSANFMAAALVQHLFVLWVREWPQMDNTPAVLPHLPHRLRANLSNLEVFPVGTSYAST